MQYFIFFLLSVFTFSESVLINQDLDNLSKPTIVFLSKDKPNKDIFSQANFSQEIINTFSLAIIDENIKPQLAKRLFLAANYLEISDKNLFIFITEAKKPFYALPLVALENGDLLAAAKQIMTLLKEDKVAKIAADLDLELNKLDKSNQEMFEWGVFADEVFPVSIQARLKGIDNRFELQIDLDIDEDYHINSAKPYQDFLIATKVSASPNISIIDSDFPKGEDLKLNFFAEKISVYSGKLSLFISGAYKENSQPEFKLTFQACSDSECLMPENVKISF